MTTIDPYGDYPSPGPLTGRRARVLPVAGRVAERAAIAGHRAAVRETPIDYRDYLIGLQEPSPGARMGSAVADETWFQSEAFRKKEEEDQRRRARGEIQLELPPYMEQLQRERYAAPAEGTGGLADYLRELYVPAFGATQEYTPIRSREFRDMPRRVFEKVEGALQEGGFPSIQHLARALGEGPLGQGTLAARKTEKKLEGIIRPFPVEQREAIFTIESVLDEAAVAASWSGVKGADLDPDAFDREGLRLEGLINDAQKEYDSHAGAARQGYIAARKARKETKVVLDQAKKNLEDFRRDRRGASVAIAEFSDAIPSRPELLNFVDKAYSLTRLLTPLYYASMGQIFMGGAKAPDGSWEVNANPELINRMKTFVRLAVSDPSDKEAHKIYFAIPKDVRSHLFGDAGPSKNEPEDIKHGWYNVQLAATVYANMWLRDLVSGKHLTGLTKEQKLEYYTQVFSKVKVVPYSVWKNLGAGEITQLTVPLVPMSDYDHGQLHPKGETNIYGGEIGAKTRKEKLLKSAGALIDAHKDDPIAISQFMKLMEDDAKLLAAVPFSYLLQRQLGSTGLEGWSEHTADMMEERSPAVDQLLRNIANSAHTKNAMPSEGKFFLEQVGRHWKNLGKSAWLDLNHMWSQSYDVQMANMSKIDRMQNYLYSATDFSRGMALFLWGGFKHASAGAVGTTLMTSGTVLKGLGYISPTSAFDFTGAGEFLYSEGDRFTRPTAEMISKIPDVAVHLAGHLKKLATDSEYRDRYIAMHPIGFVVDLWLVKDLGSGSMRILGKGSRRILKAKRLGTWDGIASKVDDAILDLAPKIDEKGGEFLAVADEGLITKIDDAIDVEEFATVLDETRGANILPVRHVTKDGVLFHADDGRSSFVKGDPKKIHAAFTIVTKTIKPGLKETIAKQVEKTGDAIRTLGVPTISKELKEMAIRSRANGGAIGRALGWFTSFDRKHGSTIQQVLHEQASTVTQNLTIAARELKHHVISNRAESVDSTLRAAFEHVSAIVEDGLQIKGQIRTEVRGKRYILDEDAVIDSLTKLIGEDTQLHDTLMVELEAGSITMDTAERVRFKAKDIHTEKTITIDLSDLGLVDKKGKATKAGKELAIGLKRDQLTWEKGSRLIVSQLYAESASGRPTHVLDESNRMLKFEAEHSSEVFHIDVRDFLDQVKDMRDPLINLTRDIIADNAVGVDPNALFFVDSNGAKRNLLDMNFVESSHGTFVSTPFFRKLISGAFETTTTSKGKMTFAPRVQLLSTSGVSPTMNFLTQLVETGSGDLILVEDVQLTNLARQSIEIDEGLGALGTRIQREAGTEGEKVGWGRAKQRQEAQTKYAEETRAAQKRLNSAKAAWDAKHKPKMVNGEKVSSWVSPTREKMVDPAGPYKFPDSSSKVWRKRFEYTRSEGMQQSEAWRAGTGVNPVQKASVSKRILTLDDILQGKIVRDPTNMHTYAIEPFAALTKDEATALHKILETQRAEKKVASQEEVIRYREGLGKASDEALTLREQAGLEELRAEYKLEIKERFPSQPTTKWDRKRGTHELANDYKPKVKIYTVELDGKALTADEIKSAVLRFEKEHPEAYIGFTKKESRFIRKSLKENERRVYDLKEIPYLKMIFGNPENIRPFKMAAKALAAWGKNSFVVEGRNRVKQVDVAIPNPRQMALEEKLQLEALRRNPYQAVKLSFEHLSTEAKNQFIAWRYNGAPTKYLLENQFLAKEMYEFGLVAKPVKGQALKLTPLGAAAQLYEFQRAISWYEGVITEGFIRQQMHGLNQTKIFGPHRNKAGEAISRIMMEYIPSQRLKQALLVRELHAIGAKRAVDLKRVALENIPVSTEELANALRSKSLADKIPGLSDEFNASRKTADEYVRSLGADDASLIALKREVQLEKLAEKGVGQVEIERLAETAAASGSVDASMLTYFHEIWQGTLRGHIEKGERLAMDATRSVEKATKKFETSLSHEQRMMLSGNATMQMSPEIAFALTNSDMSAMIREMQILDELINTGTARVIPIEAAGDYYGAFNYPFRPLQRTTRKDTGRGAMAVPRFVPYAEVGVDSNMYRYIVDNNRLAVHQGQNLAIPIEIAYELGLAKDMRGWVKANLTSPTKNPIYNATVTALMDLVERGVGFSTKVFSETGLSPWHSAWVTNKVVRVGLIQAVQNTVANTILVAMHKPGLFASPKFHKYMRDFYGRFPYGGRSNKKWTPRDEHIFSHIQLEQINDAISATGAPRHGQATIHPDIKRIMANANATSDAFNTVRRNVKLAMESVDESTLTKAELKKNRARVDALMDQLAGTEWVQHMYEYFGGKDGVFTILIKENPEILLNVANKQRPISQWMGDFMGVRRPGTKGARQFATAPFKNYYEFSNPYLVGWLKRRQKPAGKRPFAEPKAAKKWDKRRAKDLREHHARIEGGIAKADVIPLGAADPMTNAMRYAFWSTDASFRWTLGNIAYDLGLRGIEIRNYIEGILPDMGRRTFVHSIGAQWNPFWTWRAKAAYSAARAAVQNRYWFTAIREIQATALESSAMSDSERFDLMTMSKFVNPDTMFSIGGGWLHTGGDFDAMLSEENFFSTLYGVAKSISDRKLPGKFTFQEFVSFTHPNLAMPIIPAILDFTMNKEDYLGDEAQRFNFLRPFKAIPKGSVANKVVQYLGGEKREAFNASMYDKILMSAGQILGLPYIPYKDFDKEAFPEVVRMLKEMGYKYRKDLGKWYGLEKRLERRGQEHNLSVGEISYYRELIRKSPELILHLRQKAVWDVLKQDDTKGRMFELALRNQAEKYEAKMAKDIEDIGPLEPLVFPGDVEEPYSRSTIQQKELPFGP